MGFPICLDHNYMENMQDSAIKVFGLQFKKCLTLQRVPCTKYVEEAKEQY